MEVGDAAKGWRTEARREWACAGPMLTSNATYANPAASVTIRSSLGAVRLHSLRRGSRRAGLRLNCRLRALDFWWCTTLDARRGHRGHRGSR
jgi:hypothetical protein